MEDDNGDPEDRRGEEDARLSFEQSALPQALTELDGTVTKVNAALTRLLGQPESWFIGREITSVLHPLDDLVKGGQLQRLRSGDAEAISVEVVAAHVDGRPLQLLVDASLVRDPDGSPRSIAVVAHDLTAIRSAEERLAGQERLYRALSRRAGDVALVTDADLLVTFVSPSLSDMLGHDPSGVISTDVTELVHRNDRAIVRQTADEAAGQPHAIGRCVARMRTVGEGWRWAEITIINSLADPDVGGLIVNVRDVTLQLEAERALRESEARYRAIVETAQEGIVAIDAAGRVGLANDRVPEILGLTMAGVHESDVVQRLLAEATEAAGGVKVVRQQVRYDHPDGRQRTISMSSTPLPGTVDDGTLVMMSDVTEAHELQQRLSHQALHDQLTGLANRYLFEDRLEMAASRQERAAGSTAVMYVDLDGFKAVNDSYGHTVGDAVLRNIAARLVDAVRAADTVARLGGDEFAIICEGMGLATARAVAERIQHEVFGALEHEGCRLEVGGSIGIAMFPPHDHHRALALADTAMYQAKRLGGGGVIVFGVDGDLDGASDFPG